MKLKTKQKIILGISLFSMLLTLFALSINAAETIESWDISATESDNVTATLYDDYSLVISGTGAMKDWTYFSSAPWSSYADKIKSVTIEEGVATIGSWAFEYCYSLTSVVIPDSVTSIGDGAFYYCDALTSVVIPDSATTIGSYVFLRCDSLTIYAEAISKPSGWASYWNYSNRPVVWGYYIDGWDISANGDGSVMAYLDAIVDDDGYYTLTITGSGTMKSWSSGSAPWYKLYKDKIKSVIIEDGVTTVGAYAFDGCTALTSAVISNSVTTIGYSAFYNCAALTSIVIPDSVTTIGNYAFEYCTYLTSIEVSENNTAYCDIDGNLYTKDKKTLVQYAIGKKDTSFTIPDSVTTIGFSAFTYCHSLTSIVIPDSVTTIEGFGSFGCCDSLTSIVIPDSVTTIGGWAFNYCTSLTIYCEAASHPGGWDSSWNDSGCPVVWGHTHTYENHKCVCGMDEPYIEKWDISATSSDNVTATLYDDYSLVVSGTGKMKDWTSSPYAPGWYSYGYRIKSVTIEEGVTTIGNNAFYSCNSLTSVVIPDSVTTIGDMAFEYCNSLTSVVIGDGVTTIGKCAFACCDFLTSVVIPDSVTSIGSSAFAYCYSLTSIVIPDSVTTIGDSAFENCDCLTSIVIPDSITTIGSYAFYYCRSLTRIVIPDSVTTIGYRAFGDCESLTSIVIGDSVTTIGDEAFYSCDALTSIEVSENNTAYCDIDGNLYTKDKKTLIQYAKGKKDTSFTIPDSVTTIGIGAFEYCYSLTSIVIPDSVTTIGNWAFYYCYSLTIYAEAISKPSGWSSYWNSSNRPVVWGYFDKEATLGEIFTFLGYSFNEEGSMAVGFEINYEALRLYEEKTGEALEIGVVFAAYDLLLGNQPLDSQGNAVTLDDGAVVKFDLTEYDYTYYDFVITDIVDTIKDIPLVISAYINNGYENKYVQENGISDTVSGVSYNEAKGGQF